MAGSPMKATREAVRAGVHALRAEGVEVRVTRGGRLLGSRALQRLVGGTQRRLAAEVALLQAEQDPRSLPRAVVVEARRKLGEGRARTATTPVRAAEAPLADPLPASADILPAVVQALGRIAGAVERIETSLAALAGAGVREAPPGPHLPRVACYKVPTPAPAPGAAATAGNGVDDERACGSEPAEAPAANRPPSPGCVITHPREGSGAPGRGRENPTTRPSHPPGEVRLADLPTPSSLYGGEGDGGDPETSLPPQRRQEE